MGQIAGAFPVVRATPPDPLIVGPASQVFEDDENQDRLYARR